MSSEEEFSDWWYQKHNNTVKANLDNASIYCRKSKKIGFTTKTQARKYREVFEQKYRKYFRIYCCEFCQHWHYASVENKWDKNK